MIFNEKVLNDIEKGLKEEFLYYIDMIEKLRESNKEKMDNSYIAAGAKLLFLKEQIKNVDIISKNILFFLKNSSLDEIILDEDKHDLRLIFNKSHKYTLENKNNEKILELEFEGSYLNRINDVSKFDFNYRTFNYVFSKKRKSSVLKQYRNKASLKNNNKIEKSIRIIRSFYHQLDYGYYTEELNYNWNIKKENEQELSNLMYDTSKNAYKLFESYQSEMKYFYDILGSFFNRIGSFEDFSIFMKFKKMFDNYLKSNNVKSNGLSTQSEIMLWNNEDDADVLFFYELKNNYVRFNDNVNGEKIKFYINVNNFDIENISNEYIYLEINKERTDFKFKDYLKYKKEVLKYIKLMIY